jgi:hypothetical protein
LSTWKLIISDYLRQNLTFEKDKLLAISGLAWQYSMVGQERAGTYLAGLWKSRLSETLLWYHNPPTETNASEPEQYRGPSWSWASRDCPYLEWMDDLQSPRLRAKLLSAETTLKGPDPYGQVSAGSVQVQAPFKTGWLLPNIWYPERYTIWGDDW